MARTTPTRSRAITHAASHVATIESVCSPLAVSVRIAGNSPREARIAVPAPYAPRTGDTVLVLAGDDDALYVVGVLAALREVRPTTVASDGTHAALCDDVLTVADRDGRALFEYHVAGSRCVVHAPAGDLELRADHGSIDLVSRDQVRVRGEKRVVLEGAELCATAERASLNAGALSVVARTVDTAADVARHVVGALEVRATQLVERAKNAYRETEELSQTRAGRVRMIAETTFHLLARRALVKADEDVRIKAEEIALG